MKKHGFTLIELLAVIVILAIIALIATPMILGVINTAKKGSAESSALGYVDAVEKSSMMALFNAETTGDTTLVEGEYDVDNNGDLKQAGAVKLDVQYKGEKPSTGSTVHIAANGEVSAAKLGFKSIYGYFITYDGTKATASNDKINS